MIGWRRTGQALPNDAHQALARLGARGRSQMLLTESVDIYAETRKSAK